MRFLFALALLALPVTAFAQMNEGPNGLNPVIKCDPFSGGTLCAMLDSTGVHAARTVKQHAARDRAPANVVATGAAVGG